MESGVALVGTKAVGTKRCICTVLATDSCLDVSGMYVSVDCGIIDNDVVGDLLNIEAVVCGSYFIDVFGDSSSSKDKH